jgi:hypothetical protein
LFYLFACSVCLSRISVCILTDANMF